MKTIDLESTHVRYNHKFKKLLVYLSCFTVKGQLCQYLDPLRLRNTLYFKDFALLFPSACLVHFIVVYCKKMRSIRF